MFVTLFCSIPAEVATVRCIFSSTQRPAVWKERILALSEGVNKGYRIAGLVGLPTGTYSMLDEDTAAKSTNRKRNFKRVRARSI